MTVSALRWFKAALVLQILLLAYWLAVELVSLPLERSRVARAGL